MSAFVYATKDEVSLGSDSDWAGVPLVGASLGWQKDVGIFGEAYVSPLVSFYGDTVGNVRGVVGLWAVNHGVFSNKEGWTGGWFWDDVYGNYAGSAISGDSYTQPWIDDVDKLAFHHDKDPGLLSRKSYVAGHGGREMLRTNHRGLKPYQRAGLRSLGMLEPLGFILSIVTGGNF